MTIICAFWILNKIIISTLLKDLTIEQFLMQHFSDRKKASIMSSFSSRRGAIYDASQVKSGAIYDAPQVRSGAIYDALQVRSGAICDAANSRRAAIFHVSKSYFLLKNQFH